jgi:hypothetical protein
MAFRFQVSQVFIWTVTDENDMGEVIDNFVYGFSDYAGNPDVHKKHGTLAT